MSEAVHQIYVAGPPNAVYQALTTAHALRNWWTPDCSFTGDPSATVVELGFFDRQVVLCLAVREAVADSRLSWRCQVGPPDWVGSELSFELQQLGEAETSVLFRQGGGQLDDERRSRLNGYWNAALIRLKAFVEGRSLGPLHQG